MRLARIKIVNFRSVESADIAVADVTRIIGANGAGKSSILKALELFYAASPQLTQDDFFNRDSAREIEITLRFEGLDAHERTRFVGQIRPDGSVTVSRVFGANSRTSGKYYGTATRNPAFSGLRAVDGAREKRAQYDALREKFGLTAVMRAEEIEGHLAAWEEANPEACVETRDDGQFFGFQNVARGKLSDSTMLVYVPAVRDASIDTVDGKSSAVSRLLDLVVKSAIEARIDIKTFRTDFEKRFREIMDPSNLTELDSLAGNLSKTLSTFYAESAVLLQWREPQPVPVPFPAADLRLSDDGFVSLVDRTGHGLQRALIVTLLQHLAVAGQNTNNEGAEAETAGEPIIQPSLILAIEERELYQHPIKQRHVAAVLERLASGQIPGVARSTQVIFTTHSPLFVSMERFEEVRLVRRDKASSGSARCCMVSQVDLETVAAKLATAWGRPASSTTAASLKPKLHVVDGAVSEGFFAGVAVLVEGVSDRAALLAAASRQGVDLGAAEIAVIPVGGKSVLDKPSLIFRELGIPVFMLWDCDASKGNECQPKVNRALQRISGVAEGELADTCALLGADHACFNGNLEDILKSEIGPALWDQELDKLREEYGVSGRDDAQKVPRLMQDLLERTAALGGDSPTLRGIIDAIVALRGGTTAVIAAA